MAEVRRRWGEEEAVAEMVMQQRLEWLGHVAHMPDHRVPKSVLFGWEPTTASGGTMQVGKLCAD